MAKKKSNAGNAYILSQLNSYKGFSMPKVNVKAKPKADASKKKVEPKKKVETKKSGPSMYDTKVRDQYGKPVVNKPSDSKKKPYGMASKTSDKKKVVKKVEAKKTSPKKSTGFIDAANDWIDRNFRTAINKSSSDLNKKIQNKLDPVRKEAQKINTKIQKEYGDPVRKKASEINKKVQSKVGDPIRKAVYGDKKKDVKKVEAKKPEVKKPAAKPMSKEMLEKLTRSGSAYYLNTKTGKLEKNPDFKTTVKKIGDSKKVKSTIESLKRPEIRKETIKPEVVVTPRKKSEPTVSQLWKEKTGTSWSEAKKLGLSDGSASSNIALMKKLKSGEINKSSLSKPKTETTPTPVTTTTTPTPTPKPTPYAGSGMGAMERADREFEEQGFRRGGSVKKMRKGSTIKRKK